MKDLGLATAAGAAAAGAVLALALLAASWDAALAAPRGQIGQGLARPVVETARLLRQRRRTTVAPDGLLWRFGVAGPLVVAMLMAAVVPVGGAVVSDLPVGIVWFNAMDVMLWAVVWLAGWGANSVFALVSGYRFLAQALGYELPLMFALTAPAVAAASLNLPDVVAAQADSWFVVQMPVAFVVFLGSVAGYTMWGPFAYPVARDASGGVLADVSGIDRLLLLAGRYALLAVSSAVAVALFLGGGSGPWLPGWAWSLVKTLAVLGVLVAGRRSATVLTAPRVVPWAWLVVLPLILGQLLVVSVVTYRRGA